MVKKSKTEVAKAGARKAKAKVRRMPHVVFGLVSHAILQACERRQ
jgi:hypothetical protein